MRNLYDRSDATALADHVMRGHVPPDELVMTLSAQLEQAMPWYEKQMALIRAGGLWPRDPSQKE